MKISNLLYLLYNTFLNFLIIAISLQLTVYPIQRAWAGCEGFEELKKNCKAHQEWDDNLCRCATSQSSMQTRAEYQKCAAIEDQTARNKCFEDIARQKAGDMGLEEEGTMDKAAKMMFGLAIALAIISLAAPLVTEKAESCYSHWALAAAGVAAIGVEIWTYMQAKKKMKSLEEEYEKIATTEDPYQAQVQAFNFLKTEQETVADLAEKKSKMYMVLVGLFAISALVATYEVTLGAPEATCPKSAGVSNFTPLDPFHSPTNKSFISVDFIFKSIFNQAYAETIQERVKKQPSSWATLIGVGAGAGAAVGVAGAWGTATDNMAKYLTSSYAVLIISGVAAGLVLKLMMNAKAEAKRAKENAEKIAEILKKFESDAAGFCPKERDNLEDSKCYCYKQDGSKNMDRANSGTCQTLWAKRKDYKLVDAKKYDEGTRQEPRGCMTLNRQFDENCDCKKMINKSTGQNACYKSNTSSMNIGTLGPALGVSEMSSKGDLMTNGDYQSATLNTSDTNKKAAKIDQVVKKMAKGISKEYKPTGTPDDPFDPSYQQKLLNQIASPQLIAAVSKSGGILSENFSSLPASGNSKSPELKKALETVKEAYKGGKSLTKTGGTKKKKQDMSSFFNEDAENAPKVQTFEEAEYMNKNYDFKSDDIVVNDSTPIWTIISHRYNQSAYRRLFSNNVSEDASEDLSDDNSSDVTKPPQREEQKEEGPGQERD